MRFCLLLHATRDLYGVATPYGYLWESTAAAVEQKLRFIFGGEAGISTERRLSQGKDLPWDLGFNSPTMVPNGGGE